MGFLRLLLMGLLIAMVAVQQVKAPKGKGRQKAMGKRTSESSSSKASEKSAALITDETLDSNYVRLFFDQMEEEARKALEQRIGVFLLEKIAKANSSSSSGTGTGTNVVEGFLGEMKITEVPQLHLMRLKIILLGKTTTAQAKKNEMKKSELKKNELAKRFGKASDEEVLEAKARMRGLVGKRMFLELEMRLPWLLRLELVEPNEQLTYYEALLSAPVGQFLDSVPACRLHIPILFNHMRTFMANKLGYKEPKIKQELNDLWDEKIIPALRNYDNEVIDEEAIIPLLAGDMYTRQMTFIFEREIIRSGTNTMSLSLANQFGLALRMQMSLVHTNHALLLLRGDGEQRLLNFIRRTRGALARFYSFFAQNAAVEDFLVNVWTPSEFLDRLMFEYIRALKDESTAERRISRMSVDILVQVHFLDKLLEGNLAIQPEWLHWRDTCISFVDKLVDKDEAFVQGYGNIYKYMLYKLRNQNHQHPNKGDHWEFTALFEAEIKIVSKWKKLEDEGKTRGEFLVSIEEELAQAEWLDKEHRTMLDQLKHENEKFKEEFEAIESAPELKARVDELLSTHSLLIQEQQPVTQGEALVYYECPKDRGHFSYNYDAKFHAYTEYLLATENDELRSVWEYRVMLNSLVNTYIPIIGELLAVCSAKNVEQLHVDWANEHQHIIKTEEETMTKWNYKTENGEQVTRHSICKLHYFLFHRMIKAELGDNEEQNLIWKNKLRETFITQTLMELLDEDANYGNFDVNCGPEVAKEVVTELLSQLPMEWTSFYYLNNLINQYDMFRRIICQVASKDDIRLMDVKTRMLELLTVHYLDTIEIHHPVIMQIETMLPAMRMELTKDFLEYYRIQPEISERCEIRIALALLMGQVRKIEKETTKNEDKTMVEKRVRLLLEEVFRNREEFISSRNLCLLSRFIEHSEATVKGKRIAVVEDEEHAYTMEHELTECARSEVQKKEHGRQRKKLAENHRDFLQMFSDDTAVMLQLPGSKTAIQRLAPNLKIEWNVQDYTNDDQLGSHFISALFTYDEYMDIRLSANFGVNFASWHRWMSSELHKGKGPEFKLLTKMWTAGQRQMLARHDMLFCMNQDVLQRGKNYWAKMQAGLWDFVLQIQNKSENEKGENWRSRMSITVSDIFLGKDPDWNARWNYKLWTEFNRWIQQRNQIELMALWFSGWTTEPKKRDEFNLQLVEGFRTLPAAKSRLFHLIGNNSRSITFAKEILGIEISPQDISMDIDLMRAEPMAESSIAHSTNVDDESKVSPRLHEATSDQAALTLTEEDPMDIDSPKSEVGLPTETVEKEEKSGSSSPKSMGREPTNDVLIMAKALEAEAKGEVSVAYAPRNNNAALKDGHDTLNKDKQSQGPNITKLPTAESSKALASKTEKSSKKKNTQEKKNTPEKKDVQETSGQGKVASNKPTAVVKPKHGTIPSMSQAAKITKSTAYGAKLAKINSMDRTGASKMSPVESVLNSMANNALTSGRDEQSVHEVKDIAEINASELDDSKHHEMEKKHHEVGKSDSPVEEMPGVDAKASNSPSAEQNSLDSTGSQVSASLNRDATMPEDTNTSEWITPNKKDKRPKYLKDLEARNVQQQSSSSRTEAKKQMIREPVTASSSRVVEKVPKNMEPVASASPRTEAKVPKTVHVWNSPVAESKNSETEGETGTSTINGMGLKATETSKADWLSNWPELTKGGPAKSSAVKHTEKVLKTTEAEASSSPRADAKSPKAAEKYGSSSIKVMELKEKATPKEAEIISERKHSKSPTGQPPGQLPSEAENESQTLQKESAENLPKAGDQSQLSNKLWDREAERLLEQILVDNGKFEKQKANKATAEPKLNVEQAIGKLKTAIHQWDNDAFLLMTGSYQLGLYTAGSAKIDSLVMLPHGAGQDWKKLYRQHFLGELNTTRAKGRAGESTENRGEQSRQVPSGLDPSAPVFQPSHVSPSSSGHWDTDNHNALNPEALAYQRSGSQDHANPHHSPSGYHGSPASSPLHHGYQSPSGHLNSPNVNYIGHPSAPVLHQSSMVDSPYLQGHSPYHQGYHQDRPVPQTQHHPMLPEHQGWQQPNPVRHPTSSIAMGIPITVGLAASRRLHPLLATNPLMAGAGAHHRMHSSNIHGSSHAGPRGTFLRRVRRSPTEFDVAGPSGSAEVAQEGYEAVNEEITCKMDQRDRHCHNGSLYCKLCQDNEVTSLARIPGRIPLLRIKFHGYDFDLLFVSFPQAALKANVEKEKANENSEITEKGDEKVGEENAVARRLQTVESVDQLISAFVDAVGVFDFNHYKIRKGMLLALSGYRTNLRILELLSPHSKRTFRLAMLTLKLWAKRHFVAGGQFGLLNGTTLTLLFVHIFLGHPEASVPALLVHFFDTYSHWNWPTPIELEPSAAIEMGWNQKRDQLLLDWSEDNEKGDRENQLNLKGYKELVWPVLTPGLPRQNAAFNVNSWTAKIIQREFEQSLKVLQKFKAHIHDGNTHADNEETITKKWANWLNMYERINDRIHFERKYDHYLAIVCAFDHQLQNGSEFSDFVESRIRLQLLIAFGDIPEVEFMHANPEKVWHNKQCPQQMLQQQQVMPLHQQIDSSSPAHQPQSPNQSLNVLAEGDLCTLWLVGIQMQSSLQFGSIPATFSPEFIAQLFVPERIHNKFAEPIWESFNKKTTHQKLVVQYHSREELEEILLA